MSQLIVPSEDKSVIFAFQGNSDGSFISATISNKGKTWGVYSIADKQDVSPLLVNQLSYIYS